MVQIVEDRAAQQVFADMLGHVFAHSLEQRMAGRDPFQRRVALQVFLVEDDVLVFAAQFAEAWFQPFADGPERARHFAESVDMAILRGFPWDEHPTWARPG